MPGDFIPQERAALNDGIEDAYIMTVQFKAQIETYKMTKMGTQLRLLDGFYYYFNLLITLTADLEQMKTAKKTADKAAEWLHGAPGKQDPIPYLEEGIGIFKEYSIALANAGILKLPASR